MKRTLATAAAGVALTLPLALVTAAPAAAAKPAPSAGGGACAQAGLSTLRTLGLFDEAAKKQIDYSALADPAAGPIFADLPTGSFLSLGQVVSLHAKSPELFAWCR